VWAALARPAQLANWWGDHVSLDARLGGALSERWRDAEGRESVTLGEVTALRPGELLALSWRDQDWAVGTEVRFEIEPLPDDRTRLTLTHSGWEAFPAEERDSIVFAHRSGWERHLANLREHLGG
jgi:uncharacterized protein YndB with AHSA1/START domain